MVRTVAQSSNVHKTETILRVEGWGKSVPPDATQAAGLPF